MSNNGQNNGIAMIFAFISGFMAGAVISLLYAPSSGKETRQKIRDTSIEAKNRTVEFANQAGDSARQGVQTIMEQGKDVKFPQMSDPKSLDLSRALTMLKKPRKLKRLFKAYGRNKRSWT